MFVFDLSGIKHPLITRIRRCSALVMRGEFKSPSETQFLEPRFSDVLRSVRSSAEAIYLEVVQLLTDLALGSARKYGSYYHAVANTSALPGG